MASNTRPDGTPLATEMTPEMHRWLCRGGVDPDRVIPLGITMEQLLALWNARIDKKECGT